MKFSKKFPTAISTLVVFAALSATASANISIKQQVQDQEMTLPLIITQRMTGAWSTVATDDPSVKKAAEKAIVFQADKTGESLELLSIEKAQRQVVSGMNYKLTLKVRRNDQETMAKVTVWAKLDGSYQVTEWWWKG